MASTPPSEDVAPDMPQDPPQEPVQAPVQGTEPVVQEIAEGDAAFMEQHILPDFRHAYVGERHAIVHLACDVVSCMHNMCWSV